MKKLIFFLLVLIFVDLKLCCKPIGLANCGNTCFQNAFIQMIYQIDPLIDILLKHPDLYPANTLGYTFQHLLWDIVAAQKNKESFIECGSANSPTNLRKFTEKIYNCVGGNVGQRGTLGGSLLNFLQELQKTSIKKLGPILTVSVEQITNFLNTAFTVKEYFSRAPFYLEHIENIENDIKNEIFDIKAEDDYWKDPKTGNFYQISGFTRRLLFAPKFIIFGSMTIAESYFPEQLNLTDYVKGNIQALYQLRAVGVYVGGGHYIAVVRDKDGKLYQCDDSSIKEVNSWQERVGANNHVVSLYVLKTVNQDSHIDILIAKLRKLQEHLQNLEYAIKQFCNKRN